MKVSSKWRSKKMTWITLWALSLLTLTRTSSTQVWLWGLFLNSLTTLLLYHHRLTTLTKVATQKLRALKKSYFLKNKLYRYRITISLNLSLKTMTWHQGPLWSNYWRRIRHSLLKISRKACIQTGSTISRSRVCHYKWNKKWLVSRLKDKNTATLMAIWEHKSANLTTVELSSIII